MSDLIAITRSHAFVNLVAIMAQEGVVVVSGVRQVIAVLARFTHPTSFPPLFAGI